MGKYEQAFTIDVGAAPEQAFVAVQAAIRAMDGGHVGTVDEGTRTVDFSTGVTLTSWGEELQAAVLDGEAGSSRVEVRGKPKGTFLTTKWGEDVHAATIEKRLRSELDAALA